METSPPEPEKAILTVSEQIEKTSVNIVTFSALNPETGLPLNIPNILGGEEIITDEIAKLKVEEAFGQLNIQSIFGFEDHRVESCLYDTFQLDQGEEKITPHIYLLKSHKNSVFLLNLLVTPYADLNLDSYFNEVSFMSKSFSGVFRRTLKQIDDGIINESKQDDICRETVANLSGFMHHQIFYERGLRDLVNVGDQSSSSMILGMFYEVSIEHDEHQCMGQCGKTFEKNDAMFENKNPQEITCPECGGPLSKAPPIMKFKNFQFVYPPQGLQKILENDPEGLNPAKYYGYLMSVLMPRNIALTMNRLSSKHFSTLVTIPAKSSFQSAHNTNERILISTQWRPSGDKIFLFCTVGSNMYNKYKDSGFIQQLTSITINRQIVEGLEKGKNLEAIVKSSIISDWKLTESINISEMPSFQSLEDIPIL